MSTANGVNERGHREIVECYHSLLTKNLILTDDFFRTLITHGVFTEPLVNDIKKLPTHEKTLKLIDLVMTRTATGFRKFVDVLEVTGHHFLSDCLREAENYEPIKDVDVNDLGNRLPFINKSLKTEQQKHAVRQFFREAIQKEVVKHTWKGDIQTKEQLILSRQKQIEQLWQFEEEEKIREKSMLELQENYLKLQEYADDLRRETKSLQKHIEDLNKKHREELKAQVDFNMANDRHLTRLNEKAEDAGGILDNIHIELREAMGAGYQTRQAITDYQNLENNFDVFCTHYREMSKLVEHFRDERHYMSNQVSGVTVRDKDDFKTDFREYILKNEEDFTNLREEIAKLQRALAQKSDKLKELELVKRKLANGEKVVDPNTAKLLELQNEIDENKATIISRDDKILALEKQLKLLNERFKTLEMSLNESRQNEQHLQDAMKAAKADIALAGNSQTKSPDDGSELDSIDRKVPGPPPPTQHNKKIKIRNKSFDVGNNAYLLKKNIQTGPVYVMDKVDENSENSAKSLNNKSALSEPIHFKQAPSMPTKTKAATTTNYSKRLAATKALKQSKSNAMPATLLKMK